MKKLCFVTLPVLLLITATVYISCSKSEGKEKVSKNQLMVTGKNGLSAAALITGGGISIPVETANRMIQSYLDGINYKVNTDEIRSWSVNAESLRSYLANDKIKSFKFILAHNMEYINSGREGQRPDSNTHVLTIVLAGLDEDGNYVLTDDGGVLDQMVPCPDLCVNPKGGKSSFLINK